MELTLADANRRGDGRLPAVLGLQFTEIAPGRVVCEMPVRDELLAPNGFLHAASVIGAGLSDEPPMNPSTFGTSFTRCQVSSSISICTRT